MLHFMGTCNIYSSEYVHRPQGKKPLLLAPLRKYMKERKLMIAQSLHQPVFTYTGYTNKFSNGIHRNQGILGHSPGISCSVNFFCLSVIFVGGFCFWFFFFLFQQLLGVFCICLACWHLLWFYVFISLAVHLVISLFIATLSVCSFPIQGFISIFTYLYQQSCPF